MSTQAEVERKAHKHENLYHAIGDIDEITTRLEGLINKVRGDEISESVDMTAINNVTPSLEPFLASTTLKVRTKISQLHDLCSVLEAALFEVE